MRAAGPILFVVLLASCRGTTPSGHVPDAEALGPEARELWLEARAAAWDGRRDAAIEGLERLTAGHPAHVPSRLWLSDLRVERDGRAAERERLESTAEQGGWIDALLATRLEPDPRARLEAYERIRAAHPREVWAQLAVADASLDVFAVSVATAEQERATGTMEGQERATTAERDAARALRRAEEVVGDVVRRRPRLIAARRRQAEILEHLAARETDRERALDLYRRVIAAYDAALAVDPDDVPSRAGRAAAHRGRSAHAAARDDLQHAARVRPGAADIRQNLGLVAYEMGDFALAERELGAAVELRPRDADLRRNHGDALVALDRLPDAGAEYRAALRLRPDDPAVIERLGNLALRLGKPLEATRLYHRYLDLGGPNPERVRAALRFAERARREP